MAIVGTEESGDSLRLLRRNPTQQQTRAPPRAAPGFAGV